MVLFEKERYKLLYNYLTFSQGTLEVVVLVCGCPGVVVLSGEPTG